MLQRHSIICQMFSSIRRILKASDFALFITACLLTPCFAAQAATIVSVSKESLSPNGFASAKIVWESQTPFRFFTTVNKTCSESSVVATANGSERQETEIFAKDLLSGKNEIRICIESNGERSELRTYLYRDDAMPITHVLPTADAWNGSDAIILSCDACSGVRYRFGNSEVKSYSGPITMPPEGGVLHVYSISPSGVKGAEKTLNYASDDGAKPWRTGNLSILPLYFSTAGALRSTLPAGWGALIMYDQGPDFVLSRPGRSWWLPGLQLETGILYAKNAEARETLIPLNAGPLWKIAPVRNHRGYFLAAMTFGLTIISAATTNFSRTVVTSDLHCIVGYRYPWENFSATILFRYGYFFDKQISLQGWGLNMGVGYALF